MVRSHAVRALPSARYDNRDATTEGKTVRRAAGRVWSWCRTSDGKALLALLAASCAIRLPLMSFPGFFNDMNICLLWGVDAQHHLLDVYSYGGTTSFVPPNYPPLAIFLYGAVVWLYDHTIQSLPLLNVTQNYLQRPFPGLVWFVKAPVLLGDIGLIAALYQVGRRYQSRRHRPAFSPSKLHFGGNPTLVAVATYALCPAVLITGVLWGQLDNLTVCFVVVAWLLALERHDGWAGLALALALLMKPQAALFLPLFFIYLWRWHGRRDAVRAAKSLGIVLAVFFAVYLLPPRFEVIWLARNTLFWLSKHPFTDIDAFNLWSLLGLAAHPANASILGPLSASMIGWLFFAAVLLIVCAGIWRDGAPDRFFLGAGVVALALFDVATMQHERYLYPALALFLGAALCARRRGWALYTLYGVLCLTCTLNLIAYGIPAAAQPSFWLFPPSLKNFAITLTTSYQAPISALNLLVLLATLAYFVVTLDIAALFEWVRQRAPRTSGALESA